MLDRLLIGWAVRRHARKSEEGLRDALRRNDYDQFSDRKPGNHFLHSADPRRPRWVPYGSPIEVHGRDVNGLVYLGRGSLMDRQWQSDPSFIDTDLPVDARADNREGSGIKAWDGYADLHPRSRATYLEWLGCGCDGVSVASAYALLHFHGLERRFLFDDSSEEDRFHIRLRVKHLLELHGADRKTRLVLGNFLEVASLYFPDEPPFIQDPADRRLLPIPLRVEIGRLIRDHLPVPGHLMYSWILHHPDQLVDGSLLEDPRFVSRFEQLFRERFPEGLPVDLPPQQPPVRYMAFSGDIKLEFRDEEGVVPDISGLSLPVRKVLPLVREVVDHLDAPRD